MRKLIILIPLFNDWQSISKLLKEIDLKIYNWNAEVSILIVNDASTEKRYGIEFNFKKIKSIKILNMKKNTVHQRCIATGLKYICKNDDFERVFIMDADGEDRPEELDGFFKKAQANPSMTITGNRAKRSEGIIFKFMYEMHKLLTIIFTGKLIKFGNFSSLPRDHAEQLVQKPYLWNSYSSSVVKAIKNRTFIHSIRGLRYVLPSKMNFSALVFHSLAIISVFKNVVVIRSIIFFFLYLFLISNHISTLFLIPVFFLLIFVLVILKISKRSNMKEFNQCLENIGSIDILDSSNSR
jgi:polyisoprenyl-phosphate glycosyltransferase